MIYYCNKFLFDIPGAEDNRQTFFQSDTVIENRNP